MKKIFCPLVVALTLTALTGCGLKGPLYFPPKDDNSASAGKSTGNAAGVESGPVRNDRGTGDGPTQTTY